MDKVLFSCFIPGRPMVKKNTGKVLRLKSGTRKLDSPQYQRWRQSAEIYIKQAMIAQGIHEPITGNIHLKAVFHFKDRRQQADLSNLYEGIQDELQRLKVIKDDKLIQSHDGSRKVFGQGEGLEVEVRAWQEDELEVG